MSFTRASLSSFYPVLLLGLGIGTAAADVISGRVTDFDGGAPLAGVKVALSTGPSAVTAADGSYLLNTSGTGLMSDGRFAESGLRWDGAMGALHWDASLGPVRVETRTIGGRVLGRIDGGSGPGYYTLNAGAAGIQSIAVSTGRGTFRFLAVCAGKTLSIREVASQGAQAPPPAAMPKGSALNNLAFEKDGYHRAVQIVDGSRSGVDMRLKRSGSSLRQANLTWFESYPDPGSPECIEYNGCKWAGMFAALSGKQPESWVMANDIAAVHSKDFGTYKLKTLRLQQGYRQIDAKVYDMCSDNDCNGCCTRNAGSIGFLIDVEKYTRQRFGSGSGVVNWICLDC